MLLLNASNNVRVGRYQDCERQVCIGEKKALIVPFDNEGLQ